MVEGANRLYNVSKRFILNELVSIVLNHNFRYRERYM
jgi:hypothetical protein